MNGKPEGRHRVSWIPEGGTQLAAPDQDDQPPLTPDLLGRFAVQFLQGHWFIGPQGAAQRIEDAQGLNNWLAANGSDNHDALDFAGDNELKQRFLTELGASDHPPPDLESSGDTP